MNQVYLDSARLLTRVAPLVLVDDTFALNSGETKLLVRWGTSEVKIEANFVMRGTVFPVAMTSLTQNARETLQADIEIPVASLEDVYGGKLVAAMDRQHPRDLFDVQQLFAHEGITAGIRRAFVVYLASHNRPVHEVLFPSLRDIHREFEQNFTGMTAEPVQLVDLLAVRERMMRELQQGLSADERRFLLSVVVAEPEWTLLEVAHLDQFPGLRWKLQNLHRLRKTNATKFAKQARLLADLIR